MMVKISSLLNSGILNAEWVGFQGDSEFIDENGELQLGYWSFLGISDEKPSDDDWELDGEIPEEALYDEKWLFKVINKKGRVCIVRFSYTKK